MTEWQPPTRELEDSLVAGGAGPVAGIDEVGRGAWAGPVVVCAAVPGETAPPEGLTDSKRLSRRRRQDVAVHLRSWVRCYAFGQAEAEEIDAVGMTEALRRSAHRALDGLSAQGCPPPEAVLLDGRHDFIGPPWPVHTRVGADLECLSVAAASILAKCHRDAQMTELDQHYPGYGFASGVGYPSPVHRQALTDWGPTDQHRRSWAYMDALPQWRHLRRPRPAPGGQTTLL
ncbi:ribonuclease HII [Lipingzhangella sp. LS1_29]|uniref:Ribonuclease HII n=1 Tax=Lipingzhangella rawalii TaxID=2055835 RepID=A0ABU2H7I0_9ACTN|nr:ribonuclease HII [Lipingzhangella rawalii]MDS1271272.1 ribonuclease HII [Lipingzhangella rawalii]